MSGYAGLAKATFRPEPGLNKGEVIWNHNTADLTFMMTFNNSSNIEFDNLVMQNTGTNGGMVNITNNSMSLTFNNCDFTSLDATPQQNSIGTTLMSIIGAYNININGCVFDGGLTSIFENSPCPRSLYILN